MAIRMIQARKNRMLQPVLAKKRTTVLVLVTPASLGTVNK